MDKVHKESPHYGKRVNNEYDITFAEYMGTSVEMSYLIAALKDYIANNKLAAPAAKRLYNRLIWCDRACIYFHTRADK